MATPPPLPSRPEGAKPSNFSADAQRISTRDVQRATGRTEGVEVSFDSTNVEKGRVDPDYDQDGKKTGTGTITLWFVNGWAYEYENRPMGDWLDLIESGSKGRFAYYEVRGAGPSAEGHTLWPYSKKWQWATRSAAEVAAIRAAREPRHARQRERRYTRGGKRNQFGAGGRHVGKPPSFG